MALKTKSIRVKVTLKDFRLVKQMARDRNVTMTELLLAPILKGEQP